MRWWVRPCEPATAQIDQLKKKKIENGRTETDGFSASSDLGMKTIWYWRGVLKLKKIVIYRRCPQASFFFFLGQLYTCMSHPPLPLSGGTFPPFGLSDVTLKHVRITTLEIEDVYARGQNWKWKKEFPRTLTVHVEQGRSAKQCETISFLNRPLQPASNFKLGRICFRSGNFQKLFCSPWTNFPALRFPLIV